MSADVETTQAQRASLHDAELLAGVTDRLSEAIAAAKAGGSNALEVVLDNILGANVLLWRIRWELGVTRDREGHLDEGLLGESK